MPNPIGDPQATETERDTAAELVGGFPRHATRDLVEARDEQVRMRLPVAGLLIAAGTTLCALGLPTERLLGPGPQLVHALADGGLSSSRGLYLPLAQLVDAVPRLTAEPAAFLLSALALGALAAQLWHCGGRLGAAAEARLLVAALGVTAPVCWTAGTSPGPEVLGALGATYAFYAVAAPGRRRGLRAGLGLGFATGMAPLYLWCFPAAALGLVRNRSVGRGIAIALAWGLGWSLAWLAGTAAVRFYVGTDPFGWLDLARAMLRDVLAGGGGPHDASWLWLGLPALGAAWFGLCGLASKAEARERTPTWIWAWCLVPMLGLGLAGRSDWELSWLWLLGPLTLGLYRLFATRPAWSGRTATLSLAGLALAAVCISRYVIASRDPDAAWRTVFEREASRGDLLLATTPAHRHLSEHRYRVRSIEIYQTARLSRGYRPEVVAALVQRLHQARAKGSRILLDRPIGPEERELFDLVQELRSHASIDALPAAGR